MGDYMAIKYKTTIIPCLYNEFKYKIAMCLCKSKNIDIKNLGFLNKAEINYLKTTSKNRLENFVLGRYAAKKAISILNEVDCLNTLEISNGIFGQPFIKNNMTNLDVTIGHSKDHAIALVFDKSLIIGIDVEKYRYNSYLNYNLFYKISSLREINLFYKIHKNYHENIINVWTIKESLSKCLKTGVTTDFKLFEINEINKKDSYIIGKFSNFSQYSFLCFKYDEFAVSITFPKILEFNFDPKIFLMLPYVF